MLLRRSLPLLLVLAISSCRAPVTPAPAPSDVQTTRHDASVAADAINTAVVIATQVGRTVDTLPFTAAEKDDWDCSVLKLTGAPAPLDPHIAQVCGPGVVAGDGPLKALVKVASNVTSDPNLRATMKQAAALFDPLVAKMSASVNPTLKSLGLIAAAALAVIKAY